MTEDQLGHEVLHTAVSAAVRAEERSGAGACGRGLRRGGGGALHRGQIRLGAQLVSLMAIKIYSTANLQFEELCRGP